MPFMRLAPPFATRDAPAAAGLPRLVAMSSRPLSEGNWFQRRYVRWAQPYYDRMAPELRAEVERIDRWLYSRQGLWFWAALLLGLVLLIAAFDIGLGVPLPMAALIGAIGWYTLLTCLGGAWLMPEKFEWVGRVRWRTWAVSALLGLLGLVVGYLTAKALNGQLASLDWREALVVLLRDGLSWVAGLVALMALATGGIARLRRWRMETEMRSLRLAAERDAAARDAAEARLKLLQAQIHPHFIFNTLSAVQHWVDQADPRGAPLLRSLTAFLRGSTDMMGRDAVPLAQEMTMVGHYLDIMQARLGDRLHCVVDPPAAHLHDLMLPPGLVLTLVENAIEHGVEPLLRGGAVEVRLQESSEALCIDVLDEGPGLPEPLREGVGLSNTWARLAQALGPQARLELCNRPSPDQGCWARIVIPLPGNAPSSTHPNAHPV